MRASSSVKEGPKAPRPEITIKFRKSNAFSSVARDSTNRQDIRRPWGDKQLWLSLAWCHTSSDTCPMGERENHQHRVGIHRATFLPDMKDDHRIWGAQINSGDVFRWLTRFDKSKIKMIRDLKFNVDNELAKDSCFTGDLEANRINSHSKMIQEIWHPIR